MSKNFLILIVSCFLFFSVFALADENKKYEVEGGTTNFYQGFIPCGYDLNNDGDVDLTERCQLCHFFVMFDNFIELVYSKIVPWLAVFVFVLAGVLLFTTGQDPKMPGKVKKMIIYAVLGLALIYCVWIFIGSIFNALGVTEWRDPFGKGWFKIECPISKTFVGGINPFEKRGGLKFPPEENNEPGGLPPVPEEYWEEDTNGGGTSGDSDTEILKCFDEIITDPTDIKIRKCLKDNSGNKIAVNKNKECIDKNDAALFDRQICLDGLKQTTIQGVMLLFDNCGGCNLLITGGTEAGHATGYYGHSNGYKIDLNPTNDLNNVIINRIKKLSPSVDKMSKVVKFKNYFTGCKDFYGKDIYGDIYKYEGNHWDICFQCCCRKSPEPKNTLCP